jgi:hypothetical protein
MAEFKFNVLKFALAGGILIALCFALMTLASILNVAGFKEFTSLLVQFYGAWGYSVSWLGILVGAFWGFVEGFIHLGLLAWIYNKLIK